MILLFIYFFPQKLAYVPCRSDQIFLVMKDSSVRNDDMGQNSTKSKWETEWT